MTSILLKEKYIFAYSNQKLTGQSREDWLYRSALYGLPKLAINEYKRKLCVHLLFRESKTEQVKRAKVSVWFDDKHLQQTANIDDDFNSFETKFRCIPKNVLNFTLKITLCVLVFNKRANKRVFEIIIAGLGSAGSIAANGISNKNYGNRSTLGLEWGPNENDNPLVTSPFVFNPRFNTINLLAAVDAANISRVVQSTPEIGVNCVVSMDNQCDLNAVFQGWGQDSRVRQRVGVVVGGSSAKNLLFTVHGSENLHLDLQNYTSQGDWSNWKEVYRAIETYRGVSGDTPNMGACRGQNGKIIVTQRNLPGPNDIPFARQMADEASSTPNDFLVQDYNDCVNTCVGETSQQFLDGGTRSFGGNSYLGEQVVDQSTGRGLGDWEKLRIKTNTVVRRILFDHKKRAVGVEVIENNGEKIEYYYATQWVAVCGGSIFSPALLQRSGIGPQSVLDEIGAKPVYVNENVGDHFMCHYGGMIQIERDLAIDNNPAPDVPPPPGGGPVGFIEVSASTDPNNPVTVDGTIRTLQYQFVAGLGVDGGYAEAQNLPQQNKVYFRLLAWLLKPKSRGRVTATSLDPTARVFLDFNGFSDTAGPNGTSEDLIRSRNSIFFAKKVADAMDPNNPGGNYRIVYPLEEDIDPNNPQLLDRYIIGNPQITDHPCGTCRMDDKLDPSSAVVDSLLNVVGVSNLKIADVSIYPVIPDGNTCMPAYFAGVKLIEFITGLTFDNNTPV